MTIHTLHEQCRIIHCNLLLNTSHPPTYLSYHSHLPVLPLPPTYLSYHSHLRTCPTTPTYVPVLPLPPTPSYHSHLPHPTTPTYLSYPILPRPPYLFGSQHYGDHALGLGGLGGLINEDHTETELGQTGVSRSSTCTADHIRILQEEEEGMEQHSRQRSDALPALLLYLPLFHTQLQTSLAKTPAQCRHRTWLLAVMDAESMDQLLKCLLYVRMYVRRSVRQ